MSRANRRYYRTILLGLAAMAVLVWAAMDQFGISRQEILELLVATVLAVCLVITLAAGFALLWVMLRKIVQRDRD